MCLHPGLTGWRLGDAETPVNLARPSEDSRGGAYAMEQEVLRHLIRSKLADGRLPQDSIPRLWGGAGTAEDHQKYGR
jgi:hypothetical protein